MRRLAYVAYFFPPIGGAGVQRSLKFVRYLPAHGWLPAVITVREGHYWMRDPSLLAEVPPEVEVLRTRALTGSALLSALRLRAAAGETNARRSGRVQGTLRRLAAWGAVPDAYAGWVPFATRAAARVLRNRDGVLLTTSSPDSAHLVGLRLAGRGIPWVADFRDPWTRRMSFAPPSGLHRALHESLERRVVQSASRIVVTSEATRDDFLARYPRLDPARVVWIPNGYDEEDFPAVDPQPDAAFALLHLGQLNPERGAVPLLDALEAFFGLRPEARAKTRVDLVGPRYAEHEAETVRRRLDDVVRFENAVGHREAVLRLLRARVLLLMEQESPRGALILPGKTFEYLRARRPILGLVPRGAAWDLLTRLRAGGCALPSDPRSAAAWLAERFDRYASGRPPQVDSDAPAIAQFDRRRLAARLAALLDEVAPARR